MSAPGPHILVTGSTRGIGAAVTQVLASRGVRVVGHGRTAGDAILAEDLSEPGAGARLWESALQRLDGRIDVLVNNAGVFEPAPIDLPDAEWEAAWDRTLQVNLRASADLSRLAVQHFLDRPEGGRIVNVISTSGYFGRDRATAYSAAKGGVVNLTKSQAIQLAPHKIRVNAVVPNKIGSPVGKDEFDPTRPVVNLVGRPGVPEDLANAVLFLVSEESSFIVGTALFVDGGCTTMMPGNT